MPQTPGMGGSSTVPVEVLPLVMFFGFLFLVWMLSFFMARGLGTLTFIRFGMINIVFYSAPSRTRIAFLFTCCSSCNAPKVLVLHYMLFFSATGLGWKMYKANS